MICIQYRILLRFLAKYLLLAVCFVSGCQSEKEPKLFSLLSVEETGIDFENTLTESPDLNILNYLYYYNGGGIAVGDINNDGLEDVYFTANQAANRLYVNKGRLKFEDVTERAGVSGIEGWTTGTSMVDINGDGWLDIYVCQLGDYEGISGKNQLFINQKNGTFIDQAEEYGLDFVGFSTQAAFLDYDLDGDLDMYLMNHSVHNNNTYQDTSIRRNIHPLAGDQLFRNDGEKGFINVTDTAGIYSSELGYGLGIAVSDIDRNGCPDIYIANDFHENDYLYINNCDGTFTEVLEQAVGHTSQFSMGVDIADINRDGWMDIFSLDMKPYREDILKTAEPPNSYKIFQFKRKFGYYYQYPHNALQLNQGIPNDNGNIPVFSEISQILGIEASDWSWSALWADYNLDGNLDVFVTNGIYRRPNDMDYINFSSDPQVVRALNNGIDSSDLQFIREMPQVVIPNRMYTQIQQLEYREISGDWGLDHENFSNGAAYADLDNDGDLELITNNINDRAYIYENLADSLLNAHYLTVRLKGTGLNQQGIGARVIAYYHEGFWVKEQFPVRGFLSSVQAALHFGLGDIESLDSLQVIWQDGMVKTLYNVSTNQILEVEKSGSKTSIVESENRHVENWFEHDPVGENISWAHSEDNYIDFNKEPLIPHMLSREGPAVAVGDVNGDGRDDLFLGNGHKYPSSLYIQNEMGTFDPSNVDLWKGDSIYEDVDAIFVDVDGDKDVDLYVVGGGNEYRGPYKPLMDRIYINDGMGNFHREDDRLPEMYENGSCVRPADFDRDGDIDLFVGTRSISGFYGISPRSYLLENDGKGFFMDVTEEVGREIARAGMISDALWMDMNNDERLDLIVVGEWMPVSAFIYKKGQFKEVTQLAGLGWTNGWWNTIAAGDMDQDGDLDLIAGNLGLNSNFKADKSSPCALYLNDFDENGSIDPVICYTDNGQKYPFASRDELASQIVSLKKLFPSYASFAETTIENIFSKQQLQKADIKYVYSFAHMYLENRGDATFEVHELPRETQIAPVYDILIEDLNKDGNKDMILGGNFYGVGPNRGRYDASFAHVLVGKEQGMFEVYKPRNSGLWIEGEIRAIKEILINGEQFVIFGKNQSPIQIVRLVSSAGI